MDLGLAGKRALVTASTGGIGRAIAASLAGEGATVAVNGRSPETVDAALAGLRDEVPNGDFASVVSDNGTAEGAEETIRAFPELDVLVNNLGIYDTVPFFAEGDGTWLRTFEVNVLSGVRLARHHLRRMLARGSGRVIFIASEAAIQPPPEMASYSASKAMQLSVSRSLAELTKGTAVTVNTVMPGTTRSAGLEKVVRDTYPDASPEEGERRFIAEERPTSLIARLIEPREIADLVAYVASERASALNGASVRIDGGIVRSIP